MRTPPEQSTDQAHRSRRLGLRLALGAVAAVLVAVPFTLLTILVLGKSEQLERADRAIADAFHDQVLPRPWLGQTFDVLADVTHPNTWRAVAAVVAVVLWRRGRRRLVAWLVVTMTVGGLLGPLLKELVARARPAFDDPVATAGGYSFPSGHALNSMLFAAVVLVLGHPATRGGRRAALWAGAVAVVAVTAVDRLALGVHYASDVLAGWVVALATVSATTAAFATWRTREGLPPASPGTGLEPEQEPSPPVTAGPRPASWRHALPRLAGGLGLRWLGVLLLLVALGLTVSRVADTLWPFTVEDDVNRALAQGRSTAGNTVSLIMSGFGNTSTVVALCLLAVVVLRVTLHRWREALLVAAVTTGQSLVFLLTTLAVDRARPDVVKLDESPPTSSFPSGHTSAAIALYTSLAVVVHRRVRTAWVRRAVVALLVCLPALVAVGRLYRGMHHPSDVVASLVNAGLVVLLTDRLLRATPLPDDGEVPLHGVAGTLPRPDAAGATADVHPRLAVAVPEQTTGQEQR